MHARPIAALVLGLALGLGSSGCIDNDVSIRLESACFPPAPNTNGTCSYPAACDSVLLGNPVVDVAYFSTPLAESWNGTLVWPIQVGNQMTADGSRAGGANSKDAWIEQYVITYSGPVALPKVTVPITRHMVPANGTSVVIVPVVGADARDLLFAAGLASVDISAELVAKGHLADGSSFETGPFTMVFTACQDCIFDPDPISLCNAGDPTGTVPWIGSCPQPGQTSVPGCGQ